MYGSISVDDHDSLAFPGRRTSSCSCETQTPFNNNNNSGSSNSSPATLKASSSGSCYLYGTKSKSRRSTACCNSCARYDPPNEPLNHHRQQQRVSINLRNRHCFRCHRHDNNDNQPQQQQHQQQQQRQWRNKLPKSLHRHRPHQTSTLLALLLLLLLGGNNSPNCNSSNRNITSSSSSNRQHRSRWRWKYRALSVRGFLTLASAEHQSVFGLSTLRSLYPDHPWHIPVEASDLPRGPTRTAPPPVVPPFVQVRTDADLEQLYDENLYLDLAPWKRRSEAAAAFASANGAVGRNDAAITAVSNLTLGDGRGSSGGGKGGLRVSELVEWVRRLPYKASQRLVVIKGGRVGLIMQRGGSRVRCERPCDPVLEDLLRDLRAWVSSAPSEWPDALFFLNTADTSLCHPRQPPTHPQAAPTQQQQQQRIQQQRSNAKRQEQQTQPTRMLHARP
ncbi:hypothetical protein Agub_g7528, partial [Astrephomene gubernaculifera]